MPPERAWDRRPAVGIVGAGFVGGALVRTFRSRAEVLIHDPARAESAPLHRLAREAELVFVCVPTPPRDDGQADTSVVEAVAKALAAAVGHRRAPLTLIKSTIPPGTVDRIQALCPDLPLAANPEFLRERSADDDFRNSTRVVVGLTARSRLAGAEDLVARFFGEHLPGAQLVVTDARLAELTKYATNSLLALKVAFANELHDLACALGIDYDELRTVVALDPRIGESHLQVPGPDGRRGFGGACLPKDTVAMAADARLHGAPMTVLEAALDSNDRMRRADLGQRSPGHISR